MLFTGTSGDACEWEARVERPARSVREKTDGEADLVAVDEVLDAVTAAAAAAVADAEASDVNVGTLDEGDDTSKLDVEDRDGV